LPKVGCNVATHVLGSWQGLAVSRAIVFVSCLLAAAGVAAYTYYSEKASNQTPVYTVLVPQHPPEQPAPPQPAPLPPHKATITAGDRVAIARELQRELKRVGCYSGDINGVWTTSSRMAMKSFIDAVNAALPIDNPDYVLLSLVQQRQDTVCVTEAKAPAPAEKETTTTTLGTAVPAAAAAAGALAATSSPDAAKLPTKSSVATAPSPAEQPSKAALPERAQRAAGPVPSAGVYDRRRPRRGIKQAMPRPPKFVRNVLRALGIR
jgi:hypothetical protein